MSLKRLTNSVTGSLKGAALAAFAVLLGGCSLPKAEETVVAPPTKGYVRLDALTAEHPLQREVRRLRDMEETLRRIPGPPPALPPASARLPALPISSNGGGDLASAQERRNRERALLRETMERQLAEYAAGRRARTARLLEQQRAELLGQQASQDVAAARARQAEIEAKTLGRLSAEIAAKLETFGHIALVNGQLNRKMEVVAPRLDGDAPDVVPPPVGAENPKQRRQRLEAAVAAPAPKAAVIGGATIFPTMPERLETERLRELAELRRLDAEIRRIKREGRGEISDAEREARLQRLRDIEARLDAYRDDVEIALILREQRRILNAVLGAENAAAQESLRAAQGGDADRGFDFLLLGAGNVPPPTFSTARAISRLTAQRRELESLIRVGVADSVRDIARNRNVEITLFENGAELSTKRIVPTSGKDATSGQDMTQEFKNWLATETGTVASAPNVGRGGRL